MGGIPVRKCNHGHFQPHRYSVYCTVFSEICTDAEYPVIWFFPQDKGWEYAKSEKKKTIFGGCSLNSCRKKLGKNVSFRRDLDPCLLETSSLEPTNLRSHTAIQLVEGSLIVNSLVPAWLALVWEERFWIPYKCESYQASILQWLSMQPTCKDRFLTSVLLILKSYWPWISRIHDSCKISYFVLSFLNDLLLEPYRIVLSPRNRNVHNTARWPLSSALDNEK